MSQEATAAYSSFSAAYSIGFSKRPEIFQDIESPGPQAYLNINLDFLKTKSPQWRISESKKASIFEVTQNLPPPGNYEVQSSIGKGVSYSIQNPIKKKLEQSKVSPATYTPNVAFVKRNLPCVSITSRSVPQIKKTFEETPGVGSYDIQKQKQITNGQHSIFGTSQKDSIYKSEQIKTPAPNQYNIVDANNIQSPSFKFQQSRRKELINAQYEQNGPGSYNINRDFIQKKYPIFTPKNQRSQNESTHQLQSQSQKLNFGDYKSDSVPGPGAYEHALPSLYHSSYFKTCRFGMSPRQTDLLTNRNPGPGAYNLTNINENDESQKENGSKRVYSFGEAKKLANRDLKQTPGPGQYDIPNAIGQGPKYGITKSSSNLPSFIKKTDSPGPAAYVLNESQIRPSPFSVKFNSKTEGNEGHKSLIPGPGQYDLPDNSFRTSKISFTQSALRDTFIIKEGPGPTSYEVKSQVAGLPEYHKKQIEYFKNQIKIMRETMKNSNQGQQSSRFSSQKSQSVQKSHSTFRDNTKFIQEENI
ncbi:hypothetical protein ABPG72_018629 [Tetrahymena utriculariae]